MQSCKQTQIDEKRNKNINRQNLFAASCNNIPFIHKEGASRLNPNANARLFAERLVNHTVFEFLQNFVFYAAHLNLRYAQFLRNLALRFVAKIAKNYNFFFALGQVRN